MVVAPLAAGREAGLRELLDTMNVTPGMADPANALLPFGEFERLHFARFALLHDTTMGDLEAFDLPRPHVPTVPVLSRRMRWTGGRATGRVRGARRRRAAPHLFSHCEGFGTGARPAGMAQGARACRSAAGYVNRIGRTVQQVRQNSALQRALSSRVPRDAAAAATTRRRCDASCWPSCRTSRSPGGSSLTSTERTPTGWQIAQPDACHRRAVGRAGAAAAVDRAVAHRHRAVAPRTRRATPSSARDPTAAAVLRDAATRRPRPDQQLHRARRRSSPGCSDAVSCRSSCC